MPRFPDIPRQRLVVAGAIASRRPVRISITVSQAVHEALLERSDAEGRSLSNLAAFLLETQLKPGTAAPALVPVQARIDAGRDPLSLRAA